MEPSKIQNGTAYWIYNDNPELPTIVMIHGFRGTHHGLDLIAKNLDGYRLIVPDLPGFGESKPFNGKHSLENYTNWLRNFIKDLELLEPPILLGHSFGSIVTSSFASKNPEMITKLILVNPIGAPALKGPKAIMTRLSLFYYWLGRNSPEPLSTRILSAKSVTMIMSITMAKTKNKTTRRFIHDQHLTHFSSFTNGKVVSEAFETSISHNVRDFAKNITNPTLLIVGDRDDITTLPQQRELLKMFKNAKMTVIENVGHLTHYETPNEVAKAVKEFTTEC